VRAVPSVLEDPGAALSPLARDPAPAVRAELAARLGRLRRANAEALLFDPERGVREVAVRHAGRAVAGALAHVLREDNYAELRAHAARQLGRLRARAAAEALLDAIADGDGVVRIAALRALGEIADRSELVAWLERALGGDLDRRRAALFALVRLRATESEARLETLTDDPDPRLRIALAHAAQELSGEQSRVLSRLRVDPHPGVRHAAARVGQT
jgi:HEAT repeat protein